MFKGLPAVYWIALALWSKNHWLFMHGPIYGFCSVPLIELSIFTGIPRYCCYHSFITSHATGRYKSSCLLLRFHICLPPLNHSHFPQMLELACQFLPKGLEIFYWFCRESLDHSGENLHLDSIVSPSISIATLSLDFVKTSPGQTGFFWGFQCI